MHRKALDSFVPEKPIQLHREQDVRRLTLSVSQPRHVLLSVLEPQIIKADGRYNMRGRRQVDDSRRRGSGEKFGHEEVGEEEMREVVCSKLCLEPIDRLPVWTSHHTGIIDQYVNTPHIIVF